MKPTRILLPVAALILASFGAVRSHAQDTHFASVNPSSSSSTEFLVRLEQTISTGSAKAGDRFRARTLEPLTASDGTVLQTGTILRGHVDKVEAGHKTGRARIWLTFDDVNTRAGWAPLVADVFDIPGVHSIKVDYNKESEIEARSSSHQQAAEAAAAGAFVGAAAGVAAQNGKQAAAGAAVGAATAFMVASSLGQEITLEKDTKLALILERPLYVQRSE